MSPSDSAPNVPLYHYSALAEHLSPLNFGLYAFDDVLLRRL